MSRASLPLPVALPPPARAGGAPLAAVLARRRSVRTFAAAPISLAEVAQLAWATAGLTTTDGRRAAPSGGARYPLELRLVAGAVTDLPAGVWCYVPGTHALEATAAGDARPTLAAAAVGQECVRDAPVTFVLTATWSRITGRYGERGRRYAILEAGHAAQDLLLQATALSLGAVPVGAFDDQAVRECLGLPEGEDPLYLVPTGRPPLPGPSR